MKAIRLLVESKLPPALRNYGREYTSNGFNDLLAQVGRETPDDYGSVIGKIADIGRHASYRQGETLTLDDLKPVVNRDEILARMDEEVERARKSAVSPEDFQAKRFRIWSATASAMEKATMAAGLTNGNNIAYSVMSGARGKPAQMRAMLTTPGVYADSQGRPIPVFSRRSHGEGLRPHEYLASTYGSRSTVISTKNSTAKGGDLSKQFVSLAAPLIVNSRSRGYDNGIDLDIDDDSVKYRVLAREAAGYPPGTLINGTVLAALRRKKVPHVIVASPLSDSSPEGISAESVGGMDGGQLYSIGREAGITSANAIGEPLTQAALNAKHQGGIASAKKTFSGFDVINQIVQTPEAFPDKAPVAEEDGVVTSVEDAPQGGKIIRVNDREHYVASGYGLLIKPGDKVEAGDQLSEGIVDPHDIVRLRGLGEGRKYYARRLKQALDESGIKTDLKHTEMIARAALDHVTIDDPEGLGDFLPDDTVSYNALAASYSPPANATRLQTNKALGKYLHAPALHYTIGTKLSPRMVEHLNSRGFSDVIASDEAPPFHAEMSRLRTASHSSPDWLAKMQSSYISKNLIESGTRGEDTNIAANTHFAPRLAIGVGFGDNAATTGKL